MTPNTIDALSRRSSHNSVRFAPSQESRFNSSYSISSNPPDVPDAPHSLSASKRSINTFGNSVDLMHDAELLENSTKRNDKYTVRRILGILKN